MASEDRAECFGIALVRSQAFQVFAGTAASVIEQDGGEGSAAMRTPEHRVQGNRPVVDDYGFRPARGLAPGVVTVSVRTSDARTNAYSFAIQHSPIHLLVRMRPILSEWAQYIFIAAKSEYAKPQ